MNPPTVGGKFAAKDVGGGVPDAPRRGQDPSLQCKPLKGDTTERLRAGHARPLRTAISGSGGSGKLPTQKWREAAVNLPAFDKHFKKELLL